MTKRTWVSPIAAIVACLLGTLTLTACGGSSSGTSTTASPAASASAGTTPSTPRTSAPSGSAGTTRSRAHTTTAGKGGSTAAHPKGAAAAPTAGGAGKALAAFSACMRDHGASLPAASGAGGSTTAPTKRVDAKSPAFRTAMRACGALLNAALTGATRPAAKPPAGVVPAKPRPRPKVKLPPALTAAMERFTACMRSNGVAGFPEPKEGRFDLAGTGLDPESPQYKAAAAHCNPILNAAFSKA